MSVPGYRFVIKHLGFLSVPRKLNIARCLLTLCLESHISEDGQGFSDVPAPAILGFGPDRQTFCIFTTAHLLMLRP